VKDAFDVVLAKLALLRYSLVPLGELSPVGGYVIKDTEEGAQPVGMYISPLPALVTGAKAAPMP
jgi:hypothetical protein